MGGKPTFVLAGNWRQFAQKYGHSRDYVYISSVHTLMGWHEIKVIREGTWYTRPDLEQIEMQIRCANI